MGLDAEVEKHFGILDILWVQTNHSHSTVIFMTTAGNPVSQNGHVEYAPGRSRLVSARLKRHTRAFLEIVFMGKARNWSMYASGRWLRRPTSEQNLPKSFFS